MPSLTTATLSLELLKDSLCALDALTTGVTTLSVDASTNPTQAPRVRALQGDLLDLLHQCERDLGTYSTGGIDF
jgi:hypothetical protein